MNDPATAAELRELRQHAFGPYGPTGRIPIDRGDDPPAGPQPGDIVDVFPVDEMIGVWAQRTVIAATFHGLVVAGDRHDAGRSSVRTLVPWNSILCLTITGRGPIDTEVIDR